MDPQFAFASSADIWRLQDEMKNVYATQAEHSDRLLRLERRQDDDSRLRSVWGNSSPFPSILSGTPQQDPGYNPASEAFKNFDQDQHSSMLGSLHLDTEDEPRRGASRANSVRFDESALHGQIGHGSRASSDFFPLRTGSGLGSHPMTERSSSHKSEGRQSSAGQSVQSARADSLGLDARQLSVSAARSAVVPLGPSPGLFILGPVPSIIRCWLDTNFSNESLLYAAVCTGSYKSILDSGLASQLGLQGQITTDRDGQQKVRLLVYLPEATIQQSSSHSSSPTHQLPTLTMDFTLQTMISEPNALQVVLGSDILRARNADILLSQDRLTLFDDGHNRLAVPLVRPEKAAIYQSLLTTNVSVHASSQPSDAAASNHSQDGQKKLQEQSSEAAVTLQGSVPEEANAQGAAGANFAVGAPSFLQTSVIGSERKSAVTAQSNGRSSPAQKGNGLTDQKNAADSTTPDTPTRTETGSIWGSWRRGSAQNAGSDTTSSIPSSSSGYQRAGRGRGMKILKPVRSTTSSRSTSSTAALGPAGFDAAPSRFPENGRGVTQAIPGENEDVQPAMPPRSLSGEGKSPLQAVTNQPRSANPIGGASAFGWLNSNPQKRSPSATE
ncbi:MAG: hypothetical protein FRX48_02601 [Lasallia pustulata]|uniref:Ubiquitin carboxyl-terminal hydrolase 19 n=1 Tax=Lasallia pustulata TaxID=136370 RepID=A0A5M8PZZ1_9LECA|nr:MAG: hypothetical protein FRX48_02601 [Lasallia pustulata]